MLQVARRAGAFVEVIPDDEHGQISTDALRDLLDERVRLVAVGLIPTQGGLVNPVAGIGAVTRAAGVPFLLDACQAVDPMRWRAEGWTVAAPFPVQGHQERIRLTPGTPTSR